MLYFKGNFAEIHFHEKDKLIEVLWQKTSPDSSQYRLTLTKAMVALKQFGATRWISDMIILESVSKEDRQWVIDFLMSNASKSGLERAAFILNPEIFEMVHSAEFQHSADTHSIVVKSFYEKEKAYEWIRQ